MSGAATPSLAAATAPATDGDPAALATRLGIDYAADLGGREVSADFVERVPISFARQHWVVGLVGEGERLVVAMSGTGGWEAANVVGRYLGREVELLFAPGEEITAAINAGYQRRTGQAQVLLEKLDREQVLADAGELAGREDLLDGADRAPVIRLVNLIFFEAVQARASDVHLQPYADNVVVRMRVDGILYDGLEVPKGLQDEMISRVKVMARMNIAEKRLPQDGRATVQVGDRSVDLRIATLPTSFGERVVIRLLDKSVRRYRLGELGMDERTLERFRQLIAAEHGIILVTGPTGSGKTTTLYAALQELKRTELNILTLEDPIEYRLEGVSQTQVSEKKGMTFASGLRSVLRQDPDIIMVGEIRDRETAVMAIQSALTGHLVFSTLHTNDAASAVTRLLDLGIEPYLLASSVIGVVAQRLVRRVCGACAGPVSSGEDLRRIDIDPARVETSGLKIGQGCAACRETGYSGRLGLFELLTVDEAMRQRVQSQATASEIRTTAVAAGMHTLRQDGVAKVLAGATTVDEVVRVTMRATE